MPEKTPATTEAMIPTITGDPQSRWLTPTSVRKLPSEAPRALVVVLDCSDEVRTEPGELEVGVAKPVHPHHEPRVLDIGLYQANERPQSDQENNR